jgi:hypothetical protein
MKSAFEGELKGQEVVFGRGKIKGGFNLWK